MTDCTRFSASEIRGQEAWDVASSKWAVVGRVQGEGDSRCRGACVSDPQCRLWRYNTVSGVCEISSFEAEDSIATSDDYTSGRIRCAPEYDLLRIMVYSMILAFIFVMWWWLTKPCTKGRK